MLSLWPSMSEASAAVYRHFFSKCFYIKEHGKKSSGGRGENWVEVPLLLVSAVGLDNPCR